MARAGIIPETRQDALGARTGDDIGAFVGLGGAYYARRFEELDEATAFVPSFNWAAAILGPFWWIARQLWGPFWIFLALEAIALVQVCRGAFADLGAEQLERATRLAASALMRRGEASDALAKGSSTASSLSESALALENASKQGFETAHALAAQGPYLIAIGLAALVVLKAIEGLLANRALNDRFQRWRADRSLGAGPGLSGTVAMCVFGVAVYGLSAYRFTASNLPDWLRTFPADPQWRIAVERTIDAAFEWMTLAWADFFLGITAIVRALLDAMEVLLMGTPWPIVMATTVLIAWRAAGVRVAVFTAAGLAYLALLGFWERSMMTLALLGSASVLSLVVGIPLGVLCARRPRLRAVVWPILDLMQTMPSFVYLIPVIAFFGIGKVPGILATIVFGMPPVVRLTVLGLHGVPPSVREAAEAFGVSKAYMLFKVDLPLASPSIMAGINQTILMCLSMVVVASLIGAKGLGEEVLDALTYANEGKGVLAGLAILFCAMILDRIAQGRANNKTSLRS